MQQVQNGVTQAAKQEADAYRDGEDRPLGGYVVVMAAFAALVAGAAGPGARHGAPAAGRRAPVGRAAARRGDPQGLADGHEGRGHQPAACALHPLQGHRRARRR